MTREHQTVALRALVCAALPAVEAMPPQERSDAYDGISVACKSLLPDFAETARMAADALREAQSLQLHFRNLLA